MNEWLRRVVEVDVRDFLEWGSEEKPVLYGGKPVTMPDDGRVLKQTQPYLRLKNTADFDGDLVAEMRQNTHGISVKFYDKMKAANLLLKAPQDGDGERYDYARFVQTEPDAGAEAYRHDMGWAVNAAYYPFLQAGARTQLFFGGAASGKSYFLAQRLVADLLAGRNYLVARNVAQTVHTSVFNQIVKAVDDMGLRGKFHIHKAQPLITCAENGAQCLFTGLDDVEKVKSITPEKGVITDLWLEEATETTEGAYRQLTKRLRGFTKEKTEKRVTLSFNPITKNHWLYREFFGGWKSGQRVLQTPPLLIVKTTHDDNLFLTSDDKKALLNESDSYFYDVYTKGRWGTLGRTIYTRWKVQDLSAERRRFDNIRNGLDFGFADDPNALIRAHVDEKRKTIYVFEEMYRSAMHDDELAEELARRVGDEYICCDSADPKAIDDLRRRGVRAVAAHKGPGSVRYGIRFLQGYTLIIDPGCQKFINEIELYQWAKDKHGNTLQRPVDRDNHLLDALRYAVEDLMLQNKASAARRVL